MGNLEICGVCASKIFHYNLDTAYQMANIKQGKGKKTKTLKQKG